MATRRQKHRSSPSPTRAPARADTSAQQSPAPASVRRSSAETVASPGPWWLTSRILPLAATLAALACSALATVWFGFATGILFAAAAVLVLAVWYLWSSLQVLAVEPDVPPTLSRSAGAEAEQKASLLRLLDDLDYERGLGKISEQDFEEQRELVRGQARRALASLSARERAEAMLAAALSEESATHATSHENEVADADPKPDDHPLPPNNQEIPSASPPSRPDRGARTACPHCNASNEADARFCKGCGRPLLGPLPSTEEAS